MFCPPECNNFMIFGFPVYYYGITMALAVFTGSFISHKIAANKYGLFDLIPEVAVSVIVGGIIGARLYYCLLNWQFYSQNFLNIFLIREGGLSIHGALLGGAVVLYFCSKRKNISFLKLCDIVSVGLPLAQAIGRFGNFFNSEAFGAPTNLPCKMFIKEEFRPDKYLDFSYFHPTFLYEAIFNVIIFIVLYCLVLPKYKNNFGIIAACYLIMYSTVRLFIEFIRIDCTFFVFGLPMPSVVSLLIIIFSVIFILWKNFNKEY